MSSGLLAARSAPPGPLQRIGTAPSSRQRTGVLVRARHGPRRRWWNDSWEDPSSGSGSGPSDLNGSSLDGGSVVTTFFCSDGSIVHLGAVPNPVLNNPDRPRRGNSSSSSSSSSHAADAELLDFLGGALGQGAGAGGAAQAPLPLPHEQGLCIGSVFTISATNGIDAARRLNLLGFCFSTEQLFERVEDTVLRRGGEVFETRRQLKSGVHECLHMAVAIPYLFGVPPEYERLEAGVKAGGGYIERVQREWFIC